MIDVSVIVPAYNAEKFINKCLDSILAQTKKEFEIIVVNDGSKDNTLNILNDYKLRFPDKINVIDQQNQGLSVTRNNAVKASKAKYLVFIDSDDYIKETMLEELYNKAVEGDYDVVASDVDCIYPDKTVCIESGIKHEYSELSEKDRKQLFFGVYPVVCNKIYKREIFDNPDLAFEPGIWFEDVLFYHKMLPNIRSIGYVSKSFYQYLQNQGSITYTYSDKLSDINLVMNKILEYYKKENIFEEYKSELEYMYVRYMFATYIKRLSKAKNRTVFKKGVRFAISAVNEKFPQYKKNCYLNNKGLKNLYLKNFSRFIADMVYIIERNRMN